MLPFPDDRQQAIEQLVARHDATALRRAAEALIAAYHSADRTAPHLDEVMVAAYLLIRAPATFAAIATVLAEFASRVPGPAPGSLLDLGAGPGTALWAAAELLPSIVEADAIEAHQSFLAAGRELTPNSLTTRWHQANLTAASLPTADVVIAAYSLGELAPKARDGLLKRAWAAASQALVLIEPGTPDGAAIITAARSQLLLDGAHLAAPCPHELACPLAGGEGGWCHFSRRLERTRRHRHLKLAERGWEDEKFSFLIAVREPVELPNLRVLGHPQQSKTAIRFEACTSEGFEGLEIPRRDKESWKAARHLKWGDAV